MITSLPPGFIQSINATSRRPVQLAHIHFGDLTCFYSDAPVGISDGLLHDYEPRVESWGTLKDTSNIDASFIGDSLEVRSMTLTLILTGDARDNFVDLLESGIENSIVELYQWFLDTPEEPPQLIDVMVAQDPIGFSEASALFKMDLVSVIMKSNPYLWTRKPGAEVRDIVVGKMPNMPLHDMQTARWTTLDQDMLYDDLGTFYIGNGVGFRAGPDKMVIDSEIVAYNWINAGSINITARAQDGTTARPHLAGARIFHPDSVFDYSISAGPVYDILDLIADGEPYTNDVVFIRGQDPTIARFLGRPPWIKTQASSGPPILGTSGSDTVFADATSVFSAEGGELPVNPDYVNSDTGYCECRMEALGGTTPDIFVNVYPEIVESHMSPDAAEDNYDEIRGHVFDDARYGGRWEVGADPILGCGDNRTSDANVRYTLGTDLTDTFPNYTIQNTFEIVIAKSPSEFTTGVWAGLYVAPWMREAYSLDAAFTTFTDGSNVSQTDPPITAWPELPNSGSVDINGEMCRYPCSFTKFENLANSNVFIQFYVNSVRCTDEPGWDITPADLSFAWSSVYWRLSLRQLVMSTQKPWQEVMSVFDRDVTDVISGVTEVRAVINFVTVESQGTAFDLRIVGRGSDNPADNVILWSEVIYNATNVPKTITVVLPVTSMSELQGYRVGFQQQFQDPEYQGSTRLLNTWVYSIEWEIDWTVGAVNTPDEERVIYAQDLTCTVKGILVENPTPPQVIEYLLENHSTNGIYLDKAEFYRQHLQYDEVGYYFNGVMAGDIRLHDALKKCLFEGMCRFLFSGGAIRLLTYLTYNNPYVDFTITNDMVALRSKAINNQPTSTIKNYITLWYNWNPALAEYDSSDVESDIDSEARYERQESRLEMTMIRSDDVAEIITLYNLERRKNPLALYSLTMFMVGYQLQKGDRVSFDTIHKAGAATGFVAAVNRTFGQGKNRKINTFSIQISEPRVTGPNISLLDSVIVNDDQLATAGGAIALALTDSVTIRDSAFTGAHGQPGDGYGGATYGTGGYGT